MWNTATRGRMVAIEKKTKRYPSDLTDEEWGALDGLLPQSATRGRPTFGRSSMRCVIWCAQDASGGCFLSTLYWWFRRFVRLLLFRTIHDVVLMIDRERAGREASPTAGVVDSQTIKAPMAEKQGYDAAKKIVGRKRHVAMDADGRLLAVNLTTADISDSAGAQPILDAIRKRWPWMKRLFADGAYDRRTLLDKAAFLDFVVEVVRRTDTDPGFKVIPRRWVVERSIGWLTRYRRLVRDYEQRLDVSEAMIFLAMGNLLLRRITHP
jgi:putative transposase